MRRIALFALLTLAAAGCELARHPNDRSYSYCDSTGCYECGDGSCRPIGALDCRTDWDCTPSFSCRNGSCVDTGFCAADGTCPGTMKCDSRSTCVSGTSGGTACTKNETCTTGFCDLRSGVCVPTWTCDARGPACGAGWTCDSRGICVPAPCSATQTCQQGCYCDRGNCVETGMCQKDSDCTPLNLVCDTTRRTCVPPTLPPPTGCTTDAQCPSGQTCCDGACKAPRTPEPQLTCSSNGQCAGGLCQVDARGAGLCHRACTASSQCGTGDICTSAGFCFKNPAPSPQQCVFNKDCATTGDTCINGVCHAACTTAGGCANPADFCDQGICQPDWRRRAECSLDTDCSYALDQCVDGTCKTRCMQDADCSGCPHGPTCIMGYCGTN
jgi:hypothetical protein